MKRSNDPRHRKKWIRGVLCGVLAVITVVIFSTFMYAQYLLNAVQRDMDADLETISESQLMEEFGIEEMPAVTEATEQPAFNLQNTDIDVINILLIGQDRRPGQKTAARSDAMILCTVNPKQKTLTLTSFMRDMYVPIPGKKSNRINAAYAMGGTKLLNRCIEENFGITIDGNVAVDFSAFTHVIDAVGGVEVEMTEKEAEYLNTVTYKDQASWGTGFSDGINHLDGNQALAYARIRKISGNDFGRTNRQRKVLTALLQKMKGQSLPQLHKLITRVAGEVSTDLTNGEIWEYAMKFLPNLNSYRIESIQIPAGGAYSSTTVRGMQVLVPDMEKNRKILQDIMS